MDHTLNSKAHNYLLFSLKSNFQKEASMTPISNHFSTLSNLAPVPTDPIKLYDRHSNCIDLKENHRG